MPWAFTISCVHDCQLVMGCFYVQASSRAAVAATAAATAVAVTKVWEALLRLLPDKHSHCFCSRPGPSCSASDMDLGETAFCNTSTALPCQAAAARAAAKAARRAEAGVGGGNGAEDAASDVEAAAPNGAGSDSDTALQEHQQQLASNGAGEGGKAPPIGDLLGEWHRDACPVKTARATC